MNKVIWGDCLHALKKLEPDSIDLLCTDPPYGYSFMGKDWDKAVPSVEIWKECLRVLKPGAFAFIMSAPRQDVLSQMIVRIGEAGFDTDFTSIYWTYASGFPKAMNIGKMVDKRLGVEREVIGKMPNPASPKLGTFNCSFDESKAVITTATSSQAKALDGSYGGFQPKPAVEVIIVAMKPLSEKTFVDQALKNGKGVTWLTPDCAIPGEERVNEPMGAPQNAYGGYNFTATATATRFPANLVIGDNALGDYSKYFSLDAWWAKTFPFLIVPKASKGEKNEGLEGFPLHEGAHHLDGGEWTKNRMAKSGVQKRLPRANNHPTVKPLKLMSYLITLGSRPGDLVLDPFLGSGTTAIAAKQLGRNYIGIEKDYEYVEIANARLKAQPQSLPLEAAE